MQGVVSPDGRFVWVESAYEMRMSHWVIGGALHEVATQRVVFGAPQLWSFEQQEWRSPDVLTLWGRKYEGSAPGLTLHLDARRERAWVELDSLAELHAKGLYEHVKRAPLAPTGEQTLADIKRWLDAYPR